MTEEELKQAEEELKWDPYEDSPITNSDDKFGCLEVAIICGALGFLSYILGMS